MGELRKLLAKDGLSPIGTKDEMIIRLRDHLSLNNPQGDSPSGPLMTERRIRLGMLF